MRLSDLLQFKQIVIQCHDFPDADAIASGYALYLFFRGREKEVRLVYSGKEPITKSNLIIMVQELRIPIEYVKPEEMNCCELLLTVDCQYGEGNVTKLPAQNVAIIDHHEQFTEDNELFEIQSGFGGCSTLVYKMLEDEGFDINDNKYAATALYYGLYMDTNGFGEVRNPYDLDLMEDLNIYQGLISKMKNSNFTVDEMQIAGNAMSDFYYDTDRRFAIVEAASCDPNILGIISDFTLQVDKVDISIVFCENNSGYKLSVRCCSRETTATELADYITRGIGNGGGHKNKAGGFIHKEKYKAIAGDMKLTHYLNQKVCELFESYDLIDVEKDEIDMDGMRKYRKLPVTIGFVRSTDIADDNVTLLVRTREGDITLFADDNIYLMIGIRGEVYPCEKDRFEKDYEVIGEAYSDHASYEPKVKNLKSGESFLLVKHAVTCRRKPGDYVYARPLKRMTKLYTQWDADNYMYGEEGDFLVVREDDETDVYVVQSDIFDQTYTLV